MPRNISIVARRLSRALFVASAVMASRARAQTNSVPESAVPAPAKPKPPPYSLPWQLRGVAPANVIRSDTSFGFYKVNGQSGSTIASMLLGSYKVIPELAVIGRIGAVSNAPPKPTHHAQVFVNPVLGALYGIKLDPSLKLGLFLGFTLPIGKGGDPKTEPGMAAAESPYGANARSALDNAMFAVDYFTIIPGVDLAYISGGFTAQVEATLFSLQKARGPDTIDRDNTNFTAGLHLGYFLIPELSIGAELRHRRWLSTPAAVSKDTTHTLRDDSSVAIGPRLHVKLSDSIWFRPGIAVALPLDSPLASSSNAKTPTDYKIVQLDLPLVF
ncbi:MAG TPA: hypothetical protein VGI10_05270 [Polyangiaceae bacterium]